MRRSRSTFAYLLGMGVSLMSLLARGGDLQTIKGPFLHFSKSILQVRFQPASAVAKPELEVRKKGDSASKKIPFKAEDLKFWRADLPLGEEEYRIVDGDNSTPWYPVATPAKQGFPFTFTAYGDNRTGGGDSNIHKIILSNMEKEAPAFVIHTGDLTVRGSFEGVWNQFYQEGKKTYASIPFQPSVGNHDLSPGRLFAYFFNLGDNYSTYYYFTYGKAQFIALDTTLTFDPGSDQYKFLVDRLEKIKNDSPIIIYFHHPANSSSRHGSDSKVRQYLVPLFEKYGVDLVLNGHDHGYQRYGPINGVTYIVSGGGGAPIYDIKNDPNLKAFKAVYHYIVFQVDDTTIRGTMKESSGVPGDTFEITHQVKSSAPSPAEPSPKKTKRGQKVPAPA